MPESATEPVAVIGAGNMGTALAQVIASNGHRVRAWSIETDVLEEMRDHGLNTKYLAGVQLHGNIEPVWELQRALSGAGLVIVSVPSQVVAIIARDLAPQLRDGQAVLNVAKGLEAATHRRLSEVLTAALGERFRRAIGSMGGPAIAVEMARGQPMAVIVGVRDEQTCARIQGLLQNDHLKVETTDDVCGVELCSALKNVYAIALGMCDGMGLGMNTKAFLGTLAIEEMCCICTAMGGRRETVYGLAGLGDLLTTGWSPHSRNRTFGEKLGIDSGWREFMREKTVEGVVACRAIRDMTQDSDMELPLLEMVEAAVSEKAPAPEAMRRFLRTFSYGP